MGDVIKVGLLNRSMRNVLETGGRVGRVCVGPDQDKGRAPTWYRWWSPIRLDVVHQQTTKKHVLQTRDEKKTYMRCRKHTITTCTWSSELTQTHNGRVQWMCVQRWCLVRSCSGGRVAGGRGVTWKESQRVTTEVHYAHEPSADLHLPVIHPLVLHNHHVHRVLIRLPAKETISTMMSKTIKDKMDY